MTRKLFPAALTLLLAAAFAFGQEEKKQAKITGFLIDQMCASSSHTDEEAKSHETSCALMPACAKTGFAVLSKDKVYKLDEAGSRMALALLKETKTKKGFAVVAEGTLQGDTLHVDKLEEAR